MKKNYTLGVIAIGVFLSMGLAGCASSSFGNQKLNGVTQQKLSKELIKGKTTESQVRGLFGDPMATKLEDNGGVQWQYQLQKQKAGLMSYLPFHHSMKGHLEELLILFNPKGIVQNYSFSNSKVGAKASAF